MVVRPSLVHGAVSFAAFALIACSGSNHSGGSTGPDSGSSDGSSGGAHVDGCEDAAEPSCTAVAASVAPCEVPHYQPVAQAIGACSSTDIADYISACDSPGATSSACQNWFAGAATSCQDCLVGPAQGSDAEAPSGQGAIWLDYQGQNIGANVPGCLDKMGMSSCATAYQNLIECVFAAGCGTCTDDSSETACQRTVVGSGGACASYSAPAQTACGADLADGGLLSSGPCSTDERVLSVICGNGSGDGG